MYIGGIFVPVFFVLNPFRKNLAETFYDSVQKKASVPNLNRLWRHRKMTSVFKYMVVPTSTRYFKSTDGTFAATLLKKYRRYFIRYIFEKVPTVPYSVPKFGTFQKKILLILNTLFLMILCIKQ